MRDLGRPLLAALAGAALGGWLGAARGAAFVEPDTVDSGRWNVVVPGLDENVVSQAGRGTQVVGGALVLTPHVFHRADVLVPRDARAVAAVTLDLAEDSGPVYLRLRSPGKLLTLQVRPDAWRTSPGEWTPRAEGPFELRVVGGEARIGGTAVGAVQTPTIELAADDAPVRLRALTLADEAGAVYLSEDPAAAWAGRAPVGPGGLLGALALGALGAVGGVGGVLALALPVAVVLVPPEAWLHLVERLYLVRLGPWELARAALAVALLPLLVHVLARAGLAAPREATRARDPGALVAWVVTLVIATGLASRDGAWALAPLGLGFLAAPLLLGRAARLDLAGLLVRDLPAAACVAALGWGAGLLGAIVWRLALLVAAAGALLRRAPRAAADGVFVLGLALVPAAELAARSTWLDTAWDAARLAGDHAWRELTPFWEGRCGPAPRRTVLYTGGSSTGGAYQFHGEPDAFYPSRVHARLCAAGASLRTANHGDGGRDSFTVSRTIEELVAAAQPALVVVYLGVNDLLTQESPLTRAEREALEEERGAATRGLAAVAAHSRLLTGLSLLGRPRLDPDAAVVSDVPLPDAEANLRRIAAATHAAGAKLLLVPEHTDPVTARQIAGYAAMEARLAAELPGVTFLDAGKALQPYAGEGLLVDRNHLSRAGSERLAEVLAPVVAELAGLGGAVTAGVPAAP